MVLRLDQLSQSGAGYNPLALAEREIFNTYGHNVSVLDTGSSVRKFGRNPTVVNALETIWRVEGDETYATTDAIDKISSSSGSDTGDVTIYGFTISGGLLTRVEQTVTLVGQTETALTTPLARVDRLKNAGTADFVGDIYVYEDDTVTAGVPQTTAKIHMKVVAGNQSERAAFSTPSDEYCIITSIDCFVFEKTAETVEFVLEVREVAATNKVFRRIYSTVASNSDTTVQRFEPALIVPPNYDVRMRAVSDITACDVGGAISGHYAKIIT